MSEAKTNESDFDIDFEIPDFSEQPAQAVTPQAAPVAPAVQPTAQPPVPAPGPGSTTAGVGQKLAEAVQRLKDVEEKAANEPENPRMAFELMKAAQEVASLRAAYETATIFERQMSLSAIPTAVESAFARNAHIVGRLGEKAKAWLRAKLQQDVTLLAQQDFSHVHNTGLVDTLFLTRYGEVMANAKPVPRGSAGATNASVPQQNQQQEDLPEIAKAYGLTKEEWDAVKDMDVELGKERFFKL